MTTDEIAEAVYEWTERHAKALRIITGILLIAGIITEAALNNAGI